LQEARNLWSGTVNGVTNGCVYDTVGRMNTVLANASPAAVDTFDAVGNLQTLRYGNGVTNLYQYDARNRLTNLVWNTGGTVDPARQYTLMMLQTGSARKRKQLWENLLLSLARDLVPLRPGRREPLFPCLPSHVIGSAKSSIAIGIGKANPAIIEPLTKRHSGLPPSLTPSRREYALTKKTANGLLC